MLNTPFYVSGHWKCLSVAYCNDSFSLLLALMTHLRTSTLDECLLSDAWNLGFQKFAVTWSLTQVGRLVGSVPYIATEKALCNVLMGTLNSEYPFRKFLHSMRKSWTVLKTHQYWLWVTCTLTQEHGSTQWDTNTVVSLCYSEVSATKGNETVC
jgi:hypothetical protein